MVPEKRYSATAFSPHSGNLSSSPPSSCYWRTPRRSSMALVLNDLDRVDWGPGIPSMVYDDPPSTYCVDVMAMVPPV
jgi:hypothetical protein